MKRKVSERLVLKERFLVLGFVIYRNYTKGEGRVWGKTSSWVGVQHVLTFSPWWFLLSRSDDCHDSTSAEPHHPFFWCLGQSIAITAPALKHIIPFSGVKVRWLPWPHQCWTTSSLFLVSRSEDGCDHTIAELHHSFFWCLGQRITMTAPVLNCINPFSGVWVRRLLWPHHCWTASFLFLVSRSEDCHDSTSSEPHHPWSGASMR